MPGALAAGQLVDERYALEEALDEDALGTVWRAFDRGLGRHVCVRDVAFAGEGWRDDENQRRQALEAARTAIRLDHPGAVHVYDAFLDSDRLVVVTELVKARPLASVVSHKGPLHVKRAAAMGLELLEPLVAAHAIGLVHGSLSPSAVLIPDRGRFLLTGFGLAPRFLDATSTAWVLRVGTAECVAPEQASHRGSSPASDLWSFGATLYYAVEGTHAFGGETAEDALDAVVDGTCRPPTRAGKLAPLLEQLLERDVEARPTPDEIRSQLAEIAGLAPVRPTVEPASPGDAEPVAEETPSPLSKRRVWRGRRSGADAEPPAPEEDDVEGASPTVADHDWQALVTGATSTGQRGDADALWRDWTPEDGAIDASDQWLPPSPDIDVSAVEPAPAPADGSAPPNGEGSVGVANGAPGESAGTGDTASAETSAGTGADAETETAEERLFRSTPSWPPPQRRRTGVAILCTLVMVVLVALLVTDGRIGRNSNTATKASQAAAQRPVLATDPAAVPSNWITYRHPAVDFGTSYPPGWTVREEGQVVTIRDPATGTQLRIDYRQPPGEDPELTWTDLERSFSAQHPNDYRRLQLNPASYLGHTAALWEFTYAQNNQAVHAVDLGFLTKKYRFALYFEAPADDWQTMLPTFRGFLSSFQAPK